MIGLYAVLLATISPSANDAVPLDLSVDEIVKLRDNAVATGISFDYEEAIAPAVNEYSDCLNSTRTKRYESASEIPRNAERAIRKCAKARTAAMGKADALLSRQTGWELQAKREAEIKTTFDNIDASSLKLAEETAKYIERTQGQ